MWYTLKHDSAIPTQPRDETLFAALALLCQTQSLVTLNPTPSTLTLPENGYKSAARTPYTLHYQLLPYLEMATNRQHTLNPTPSTLTLPESGYRTAAQTARMPLGDQSARRHPCTVPRRGSATGS